VENHIFAFFSNISNVKVPFFELIRSIAVFRIWGCLHWLSCTIHLRVVADHNFQSHDCGFCRL